MLRRTPVVALAALLLAGCTAQFPGPLQAEVPGNETGGFLTGLLAAMPAIDGPRDIVAADLAVAIELAGAPAPEQAGPALADWIALISGIRAEHTVSVPWPGSLNVMTTATVDGQFAEVVGFDLRDIDAYLEITSPPSRMLLAEGAFDEAAITAALGEPAEGIWVQPGQELAPDLDNRGHPDHLGRPIRLTGDAGRLLMSFELDQAEAFRDGAVGNWDAPLTVAQALDAAGVYSAWIVADVERDDVVGVGLTRDGDTVVARQYQDPDAATAAAEDLPGTEDHGFTVLEAQASDGLLTVRLERFVGMPPWGTWDLIATRSPVLG